jgi:ParB family chromosome partitioning protein
VSKKKGLPNVKQMRHDLHFVEELESRRTEEQGIGQMIHASLIDPNPDQPRNRLGELKDLIASIQSKGIIEPIIVRRVRDRYQIISGERRYRAGLEAGLEEFPSIVMNVDDSQSLEISLIENLQRKDLSPFEEAEGMEALRKRYGYTHEEIAKKIGKSRGTVTETLSLNKMPDEVKAFCEEQKIGARSMLLQIARQKEAGGMKELAEKISREGYSRDEARSFSKDIKEKAPKPASFRFTAPDGEFTVHIKFKKKKVGTEEVLNALTTVEESLKSNIP